MNLFTPNLVPRGRRKAGGFTLVECLIYMAVLLILFNLALTAYYKFTGYSRDFHRNAADVVRVLKAGEQWRADVRLATGIEWLPQVASPQLRLTTGSGEVRYTFEKNAVWRQTEAPAGRRMLLDGVSRSEFIADQRSRVQAWRWEMELRSAKSAVRVRPAFSFTAVPDKEFKQ